MVQVIKAGKGTSAVKLTEKLQEKAREVLKRMEPELIVLFTLSGKAVKQVSKDLAHKISHNKALRSALKALPKGEKISNRSLGQMVVGWGGWGGVAMQAVSG